MTLSETRPLVSVVIPVYQVRDYLAECVSSVLAQTHARLDIVLVDDGSTDGSGALCDSWAAADSRVRVLHQGNRGLSAARNSGTQAARGSWITFVDSDDVIDPAMIETMLEHALRVDADIVHVEHVAFAEHPPVFQHSSQMALVSAEDALVELILTRPRWEAWGKLYAAHVLRRAGGFAEGMVYEDLEFTPRAIVEARRVALCPARLYGYRKRAGSIMAATEQNVNTDLFPVLERNLDRFPRGSALHDRLRTAWVLHAAKHVESMSWASARRNRDFLSEYRRFSRRHAHEVLMSRDTATAYKAMWSTSLVSTTAFHVLFSAAAFAKRRGLPGMSRRS